MKTNLQIKQRTIESILDDCDRYFTNLHDVVQDKVVALSGADLKAISATWPEHYTEHKNAIGISISLSFVTDILTQEIVKYYRYTLNSFGT